MSAPPGDAKDAALAYTQPVAQNEKAGDKDKPAPNKKMPSGAGFVRKVLYIRRAYESAVLATPNFRKSPSSSLATCGVHSSAEK